jgi:transcription-repair coupling factor (superfamily II helicase)
MDAFLNHIRALPAYRSLLADLGSGRRRPGLALPRASRLPVLAALHRDLECPLLLITDRADHALALLDELKFWTGQGSHYLFPEPNPLFYEEASWGNAIRRDRLQALTALAAYHLPFAKKPEFPPILVTSGRALMTRSLPRRDFLSATRQVKVGGTYQLDALVRAWLRLGYQYADTVLEPGQFSRRGGLLDVWTPADAAPARLDFFGDELDAIRRFDPASQRTLEQLDSILVTPAREFLLTEDQVKDQPAGEPYTEFDIPWLHPLTSSLVDYLPRTARVFVDDLGLLEAAVTENEEQAVKLRAE